MGLAGCGVIGESGDGDHTYFGIDCLWRLGMAEPQNYMFFVPEAFQPQCVHTR